MIHLRSNTLSRGWGPGTGFGSLMCWIIAVGNFVELMDKIRNQVGFRTQPWRGRSMQRGTF